MTEKKLKMPSYGGQALIEGVLMRGKRYLAAAFRKPDGSIHVVTEELGKAYQGPLFTIPFVRGLFLLWDSLVLGSKYLTMSADFQMDEKEKMGGPATTITFIISGVIAIGIFILAPAAISGFFSSALKLSDLVFNLVEGLLRLIFFLIYLYLIGKMKEIERVFAYHGAEHKTINAFESGTELIPEKVINASSYHPRCGTGFLLIVVVFSILVYSLLGRPIFILLIISRILLLPVIVMLAYEYMRWTASHLDQAFFRFITWPNLALQRMTTRNPDLQMVEVAIDAFSSMKNLEEKE